ncbi:hypothetical protein [uncultured Clostridium sp.]|uniref:hypothetical protein n=1 Tax=uncultured Clostridium sp. TaxID=59620 RepID=UPI0025D35B82|nr:hypothetical protein [uncultured Clostridium sp.]
METDMTMKNDTISLAGHCDAGCKMAVDSMEQISRYVTDENLRTVINSSKNRHKDLEQEASGLLNKYGTNEKEPAKMASAFSWISTEMKMMFKDDNNQVAKIMMNGCNMGIQSISEDINKYSNASGESVSLAKKIVKAEENFMKDLERFL